MKSLLPSAGLLLLAATAACSSTDEAPPAPEWTILFDGSSLDAWRGYRAEEVPEGWQIIDGALVRVAPCGELITRDMYGNFVLEFEWRVSPAGNSGVFYLVTEEHGVAYETGPEYQVLDNTAHGDGLDPRTSAAANYALHAPTSDLTRPVGEWNEGRIVLRDGHVEHWLNGTRVLAYELWTDAWRDLVAASKFNAWPDYGMAKRGHIALQDHGDRVSYRNIRIQDLD